MVSIHPCFLLDNVDDDDICPGSGKKKNGDVTVTTFMVVRFCKFTLAVAFLWLYAHWVHERLKAFGFTLMLFYFIYLGMETYTIYLFEKKRMKREKRENEELSQK